MGKRRIQIRSIRKSWILESFYLGNFYTKYKYDENKNIVYRLHARDDEDNVRTKKELNYYYTDDDSISFIDIGDTHKIDYTYDYLGKLTKNMQDKWLEEEKVSFQNAFMKNIHT